MFRFSVELRLILNAVCGVLLSDGAPPPPPPPPMFSFQPCCLFFVERETIVFFAALKVSCCTLLKLYICKIETCSVLFSSTHA